MGFISQGREKELLLEDTCLQSRLKY